MQVRADLDSGNIDVINAEQPNDIRLKIRDDKQNSEHRQWFNFHLDGEAGKTYTLHIENAGKASFPGWNDNGTPYQACASYDGNTWFRAPTTFDQITGDLSIHLLLAQNSIQLAFFPPYPYAKHLALIESAIKIPHCQPSALGKTIEGRDITLLTIGAPAPHKKRCWFIARQHPGETMAEWFMEGLIEYFKSDTLTSDLLKNAVFYLVPNMNPDGTYHGNLRTNSAGTDLDRAWLNASIEKNPEVFYVRNKMQEIGVDFFMDVHGDEERPVVFFEGSQDSRPEIQALEKEFIKKCMEVNAHVQNEMGYPPDEVVDYSLAAPYATKQFGCVSLLLEMPFKDDKNHPKPEGWTPNDCKKLAINVLTPLQAIVSRLTSKQRLNAPGRFSVIEEARASSVSANAAMPDIERLTR